MSETEKKREELIKSMQADVLPTLIEVLNELTNCTYYYDCYTHDNNVKEHTIHDLYSVIRNLEHYKYEIEKVSEV